MNWLKQWILNRKFVIDSFKAELERQKEPTYIKAFTDARKDLDETNVYNTEQKAKELADKMLCDMLSIVDEKMIFTVNARGMVYMGGEMADEARLSNLKAEAELIENTALWKIMNETPAKLAQEAMFIKGESLVDLQKGRSILYVLNTQKRILDALKSYKPRPKPIENLHD